MRLSVRGPQYLLNTPFCTSAILNTPQSRELTDILCHTHSMVKISTRPDQYLLASKNCIVLVEKKPHPTDPTASTYEIVHKKKQKHMWASAVFIPIGDYIILPIIGIPVLHLPTCQAMRRVCVSRSDPTTSSLYLLA